MKFLFLCFSSAVAALAVGTSAAPAPGPNVAALLDSKMNLNEKGNKQSQAESRRLSEAGSPTCDKPYPPEKQSANVIATFSETTLQASFTCAGPYDQGFVPAFTQNTINNCCASPQDDAGSEIAKVLGVKGKAVKDNQTVVVTLEKIPDKRDQKIYYRCNKTNASEFCLVALALPPPIGQNDCAIDKVITIPLTQTVSSAAFKCVGGTMDLQPFEVASGKCSNNRKTANAVQVTEVVPKTGEFKVAVDQRPNQTEQLCYTCTYAGVPQVESAQPRDRTCSVLVTVEATASSTSTATTTSSARSIIITSAALSIFIALFLTIAAFN